MSCPRNQQKAKRGSTQGPPGFRMALLSLHPAVLGGGCFPSLGFHRGGPGEEYNIYGDSDTELPSFMEVGNSELVIRFQIFFWGKHGRGYIDFNYAMYVYIFINLIFIHIYLFCSPLYDYMSARQNLRPLGTVTPGH